MNAGRRRVLAALAAAGLLAAALGLGPAAAQVPAPAGWREEFEAVCVKTDLALSLATAELADLVARCDRLEALIAVEGEIVRKVYLKRLRSCRALFAYVLETRGAAAPPAATPSPPAGGTPAAAPDAAAPEQRPAP